MQVAYLQAAKKIKIMHFGIGQPGVVRKECLNVFYEWFSLQAAF